MKTQRINESEISSLKISSLPTRPTLPSQYGGRGFTAAEMKSAFDALPLFIIERLNLFIDEVFGDDGESLYSILKTLQNELNVIKSALVNEGRAAND